MIEIEIFFLITIIHYRVYFLFTTLNSSHKKINNIFPFMINQRTQIITTYLSASADSYSLQLIQIRIPFIFIMPHINRLFKKYLTELPLALIH